MSEDMLMCFDSPLNPPAARPPMVVRLNSPLIPCPTLPFDCVAEANAVESDPFEKVYKSAMAQRTPVVSRKFRKSSVPASPDSPKVRGIPGDSELDISAALTGRILISSTPNTACSERIPAADPTTPTSSGRSGVPKHRTSFDKTIMEMSADHLRMIVKKKMERLEALKRGLTTCTPRTSTLRRSLSTSDLLPKSGKREYALDLSKCWESHTSHDEETALQHSLMNDSVRSQGDCTNDLKPVEIGKLKEEAKKLSSFFKELTICQDDGLDETLEEPIKERTIRKMSKSYSGKSIATDDILSEMPPWDFSTSDSEDEEGLPKIKRFSLSTKSEANDSPEVSSILSRYKKTRSSLQLEKDPPSQVKDPSQTDDQVSSTSDIGCDATLSTASETIVIPVVAQPPLLPESISGVELKLKNAAPAIVKKGPLKAVVPLPNMVKTGASSNMKTSKNLSTRRGSTRPNSPSSVSEDSQIGSRGREKVSHGSAKRSNSSSALLGKQANLMKPPQPKLLRATTERPDSAPSPCRGVLEAFSSRPIVKGNIASKTKRPLVAPGKENWLSRKK